MCIQRMMLLHSSPPYPSRLAKLSRPAAVKPPAVACSSSCRRASTVITTAMRPPVSSSGAAARTDRVYILRQNTKMFGLQTKAGAHFVVGFDRITWARWVQYTMSPVAPPPYLDRRNTIDVAPLINNGMTQYGLPVDGAHTLDSLTLDIESDLVIPKVGMLAADPTDGSVPGINGAAMHLDSMARDTFLLLPFTHRVGVVLPFDIREDTQTKVVFAAQVIDPTDSKDLFRRALTFD